MWNVTGHFCDGTFWDWNETWNNDFPDFSPCFEDIVFISLPCISFCIILFLNLCHLFKQHVPYKPLPWTSLIISKICISFFLLVINGLWCGILFHGKSTGENISYSSLISSCLKVLVFLLITVIMLKHKSCGVTTSNILSTFWLFYSLCSIIVCRSVIIKYFHAGFKSSPGIVFFLNMIYYPIIFIQLILSIFVHDRKYELLQENKIMDEVTLLAHVTFLWFTKLIYKSRKKILAVTDLKFISEKLTANYSYRAFSRHWTFYLIQGKHRTSNLAWALVKSFWPWIVVAVILNLFFLISLLLPPLLLDWIIDFMHNDRYSWRGSFFAAVIFITDCVGKLLQNSALHYMFGSSIQFQSALMGALFRKNLCLSTAARKNYNSGTLMNLLSVDIKRIQMFGFQASVLISAPLKISIITYLLWRYIGLATLAGVLVIMFLFPVSYYVSRCGEAFSGKQMQVKDIRLKHMSEFLNGIKILKLYAWELPFAAKISEARKEEIKWIRRSLLCYIIANFAYFCAPFIVSLVSFATFLLIDTKNILDPTRAFVSLILMNQLKYVLSELPDAISELIQCHISFERLKKFFNAENLDNTAVGSNPEKGATLTMKNASFSWAADSDIVLHNINLNITKGKLIAVIGPVGSGKSSLLSALLGEMYKRSGSLDLKGSIAYVPQQAWVLNRSLKNNILLVKHLVEEKYKKTLDLCCLKPDLEILPAGEETEIGEKGANLSGGQRLRINLAQAVYQDKDIYLLDDPLSAVDVHVRKALFNDVIGNNGLLKNKTRLLVTHDISILHDVDMIISMKDGHIDQIGSYSDLMKWNESFTCFIEEHSHIQNVGVKKPRDKRIRSISFMSSHGSTSSKSFWGASAHGDQLIIHNEVADPGLKRDILTDNERMEIGGVNRSIYWNYIKCVGILLFIFAAIWYMSYSTFTAGANIWLSKWSEDIHNGTQTTATTTWRLSIYGLLGIAQVFSIVVGSSLLVYGTTKASAKYHNEMLQCVMKSPMSFFDSTPIGRIINRFTTDLDTLDILLFYRLNAWMTCLFYTISAFIIIGMNTPIFLTSLLPLGIVYYIVQKLHLNTFRQTKRLESTTRSLIYSLFMEAIHGVSSISAYKIKDEFIQNFEEKLDMHFVCTFNSYSCDRWINFWLNTLGSFIVFVATLLAIENRHVLSPATVALVITYALSVTDALKWFVKMNSELEDKLISVERVNEYSQLKSEAPWDLYPEYLCNWPQNGQIVFVNYSTRYRENFDLVLKDINLTVNANQKVGVVGRTGAGKSSITLALFRIIEPVTGTIFIDDVDITKVGLHNLRSSLTIIPQEPVLFTGSLRMNLDPKDEHTDKEIWKSLEKSYLKTFVSSLNEGLQYRLEESGANLSAGQRQLLCLARALLKNTKILILDEATASIDMETDSRIQSTIRTAFADRTVITIAHRLNTVLDYDKIVVMEKGVITEVGNPSNLLKDPESIFFKMNKDAGFI